MYMLPCYVVSQVKSYNYLLKQITSLAYYNNVTSHPISQVTTLQKVLKYSLRQNASVLIKYTQEIERKILCHTMSDRYVGR